MLKRSVVILILLVLALTLVVNAQEIVPRPGSDPDPNANVSWPPPVYVLRGTVDVLGTANLPGMSSFFIEFRPLEFSEEVADPAAVDPAATEEAAPGVESELGRPWFPATLPNSLPVLDDVLGTWNTETAPDGLYEMRLVVNIAGQTEPQHVLVSPLRIENNAEFPDAGEVAPLPEQPASRPTLQPSPTQQDTTPQVEVIRSSVNIRSGDSIDFPVQTVALRGETFRIIGIADTGSGWYFIELPDGTRGWISPTVVSVSGDLRGIPRVEPPPPPFTPTPIPTNTPVGQGDLIADNFTPDPNPPTCGVDFDVLVNVRNNGTAATLNPVNVVIRDVHVASGQTQVQVTTTQVPVLSPGQNFVVSGTLNVTTFFNEQHRIDVIVDPENLTQETNENNNTRSFSYTLQPGGC